LGEEWNHLILCSGNNEKYIKSLTSHIDIPIQIHSISSKAVSYDEINNLFLNASFWKKYHENYVFIYDENTILSEVINTKLTEAMNQNVPYIGTSLPFTSYPNNKLYGFSSLRKRSHMIETLERNPELQIASYQHLENDIYNILGLCQAPECAVFSKDIDKYKINLDAYIFNINFATTICNKKTNTLLSSKYALKSYNNKLLNTFFDYFSM
jgi:hypothetical protein